jgi:hypothetical protein
MDTVQSSGKLMAVRFAAIDFSPIHPAGLRGVRSARTLSTLVGAEWLH